jgi:hypothetical protein
MSFRVKQENNQQQPQKAQDNLQIKNKTKHNTTWNEIILILSPNLLLYYN